MIGPCVHLLHFGPIPRPQMATWGSPHWAKAEGQLFARLLVPSHLLAGGKGGLVGQP